MRSWYEQSYIYSTKQSKCIVGKQQTNVVCMLLSPILTRVVLWMIVDLNRQRYTHTHTHTSLSVSSWKFPVSER